MMAAGDPKMNLRIYIILEQIQSMYSDYCSMKQGHHISTHY